ncbi:MAG: hypothetical protein HY286_12840 [Planctomycetes bacterium]|nr:hypothetical protein [Planctomycetota bacterium]
MYIRAKGFRILQIVAAAAAVCAGISAAQSANAADYGLWRARAAASDYEIYYSARGSTESLAKRLAELLQNSDHKKVTLRIAAADAGPPSASTVRILFGSAADDAIARELRGGAGGRIDSKMANAVAGERDALSFFTEIGGRPVLGLLANDEAALAACLNKAARDREFLLFPDRPGAGVFRGGECARAWSALTPATRENGIFYFVEADGEIADADYELLKSGAERALVDFYDLAGRFEMQPVTVVLYHHLDAKIRATGERRIASSQLLARRVDAVYSPGFIHDICREIARVASFGQFGAAANPTFEQEVENRAAARAAAPPAQWRDRARLPMKAFMILLDETAPDANIQFESALPELKAAGANAILLTSIREPGGIDGAAADDTLRWRAQECRRAGFYVMLGSRWLGQRNGAWIGEPFTLPEHDWNRYFEDIKKTMLHDAALAEELQCAWWFFGTELRGATSVPGYESWWRVAIGDMRKLYHGGLAYASSWDLVPRRSSDPSNPPPLKAEFEILPFWKDLDAVAVTGYIPLSVNDGAGDELLDGGSADFARRLEEVARREGKPLMLAEIGYDATESSYRFPWRGRGEASAIGQSRAYGAFLKYLTDKDWLAGCVINGYAPDDVRAPGRSRSVKNRGSLSLIKDFFLKIRAK